MSKSVVSIVKGTDAEKMVAEALSLLGGVESLIKPGSTVVFKPNGIGNRPPERSTSTSPEVIYAVVKDWSTEFSVWFNRAVFEEEGIPLPSDEDVLTYGEVAELARSFDSMADNLERTESLRRNMVADIAHELRTPLSNLRGYLEAINDGLVKPDNTTIQSLSEEASTLSRLIDDLQELSLADAGELKLVFQAEDITGLIKQTITALQTKASVKDLTIEVDLHEDEVPRHDQAVTAEERSAALVAGDGPCLQGEPRLLRRPGRRCLEGAPFVAPGESDLAEWLLCEAVAVEHAPLRICRAILDDDVLVLEETEIEEGELFPELP